VRRCGYYAWEKRIPSDQRDEALVSALRQARESHLGYGVQSLIDELLDDQRVSYGKGYRVCRDYGLLQYRRKPHGITLSDPAAKSADDLVKRDFTAAAPGEKWLTDITEMRCQDGKLYLCSVLDCFDAAIVGISIDTNKYENTALHRGSEQREEPIRARRRLHPAFGQRQSVHLSSVPRNP
jgi:hypothetical protein